MKWNLIISGENSGKYNMDFDIELARICRSDEAYFRLYRWKPYAVSLGANQKLTELNIDKISSENIDIVKRPTGGRAILHAEELTYSVVIPSQLGISSKELYRKISNALVHGLKKYNSKLNEVELEYEQPDFGKLYKQPAGTICFSSVSKSEVKFKGKKIIGSAQRKMNNSLLQHGSILCGGRHRRLPEFLNLPEDVIEKLISEMEDRTIEIETITSEKVDYSSLSINLISAFESEFNVKFEQPFEITRSF